MNIITMYELYGKIYDGTQPKHIRVYGEDWYWNNYDGYVTKGSLKTTPDAQSYLMDRYRTFMNLDQEVEILEEKETKPLTKKDIEALGYACGEIQKCFTNGWTKSLENKPLEEEKKIEKIQLINNGSSNSYAIYDENGTKCALTKHSKVMVDKINEIIDEINKIKEKKE